MTTKVREEDINIDSNSSTITEEGSAMAIIREASFERRLGWVAILLLQGRGLKRNHSLSHIKRKQSGMGDSAGWPLEALQC